MRDKSLFFCHSTMSNLTVKMSMDNDEANREKELSSAPGVQTPDLIEEERPDPYPEGSPGSRDSSPG